MLGLFSAVALVTIVLEELADIPLLLPHIGGMAV